MKYILLGEGEDEGEFSRIVHCTVHWFVVSIIGQDRGYTVKYNPLPDGVPGGESVYLTVYPEPSPNTDII